MRCRFASRDPRAQGCYRKTRRLIARRSLQSTPADLLESLQSSGGMAALMAPWLGIVDAFLSRGVQARSLTGCYAEVCH